MIDPDDRDTYHDRLLELGTFYPIENKAAVSAVVDVFIRELAFVSDKIGSEFQAAIDKRSNQEDRDNTDLYDKNAKILAEFHKRCVLSFDDFLRFVGHEEAEAKKELYSTWSSDRGAKRVRKFARNRFARLQNYGSFPKTFDGYRSYLKAANENLYKALDQELPAILPEEPRRTHTYITSTTKTGKTELLKALCLNYIHQPDYAGVVILDPGGDMAPQMARWRDLIPTAQLVYIDPNLSDFNSPVINPFDADHLNKRDRLLLVDQIVLAIGSLVEGKLGGSLTVNMEAILYPCVRLLVDLPNTTLLDLQALMKDNEDLIKAGCNHPDPTLADFFQTEFREPPYKVTKGSIITKLRNILGKGVLDKVLCGRTSINLERLMAERKFIVVNLAKGKIGKSESSALGVFLVSLITAIAMRRVNMKETERPMTHLIIDECQNFVTSAIAEIIEETRKFGLSLTLAQLRVGGAMPKELTEVITSTTNVKVAGRSDPSETKRTGALVGVPGEDISKLEAGQFYWKNGTAPTFLLHVRSDRIKDKGGVNNDLWLEIMKQQQQFFYRHHDDKPERPRDDQPAATSRSNRKYDLE